MYKVIHFEIPAEELSRATMFYRTVFGWDIIPVLIPEGEYGIIHTVPRHDDGTPGDAAEIVGGALIKKGDSAISPIIVIDVPDIQAYVKAVKEAGGTVALEAQRVSDRGWYARVRDTENNVIGLWEVIEPGVL